MTETAAQILSILRFFVFPFLFLMPQKLSKRVDFFNFSTFLNFEFFKTGTGTQSNLQKKVQTGISGVQTGISGVQTGLYFFGVCLFYRVNSEIYFKYPSFITLILFKIMRKSIIYVNMSIKSANITLHFLKVSGKNWDTFKKFPNLPYKIAKQEPSGTQSSSEISQFIPLGTQSSFLKLGLIESIELELN